MRIRLSNFGRQVFVSLIALTMGHWSLPGAAADDPARVVDTLLTPKTPDAPGVAVAVYQGGRVVYLHGYGLADLEQQTPVTPKTRFMVASVSKQFTALSVALLAEDGKISLDADVRSYLPWLPDFGAPILISDLVHHLSGLKDSNILFRLAQRQPGDRVTRSQFVALLKRQRTLTFTPGTEFYYSNSGYGVLGELVQQASGKPLRQFAAERIFQPMEMTDSFFRDDSREIIPRKAQSYEPTPTGWRLAPDNNEIVGPSGLFTTAEDMGRWLGFFDKQKIGGPELFERLTAPSKLRDGTPSNYGFGLYLGRTAGRETISHSGSIAGYRALLTWLPKERFGVVLLSNGAQELGVATDGIINAYLGAAPAPTSSVAGMIPQPVEADADALAEKTGHYLGPKIWSADLAVEGGKLYWLSTAMPKAEITLRANDYFSRGQGGEARYFHFERNSENVITGFRAILQLGTAKPGPFFARIAPADPTKVDLSALTGDYAIPELDVSYHFEIMGGKLAATSLWSPVPVTLTLVAPDRFDTDSPPLASLAVRRNKSGQPIGFEIVGGSLVGTLLERNIGSIAVAK